MSTSTPAVAARNEPDCTSSVCPLSSSATMSPGSAGATVTSPACSAVNVLMKKLSPPRTERFSPERSPPPVLVSIAMLGDLLTIAPASAWMDSPASRLIMARA